MTTANRRPWHVAHDREPDESRVRRALFAVGRDHGSGPALLRPARAAAWSGFLTLLVLQHPGVRSRRLAAVSTFWRCQGLRRLGRSYDIDLGPDNGRLRCPPWSALGCLTAAAGTHEFAEQSFVEGFVRPGDVVVDAGANIGFYTVPLAVRGAVVAAFEPSQPACEALDFNVVLNGLDHRVRVFGDALSDFDGEAFLTRGLDATNRLVSAADGVDLALAPARVRRLDSVVAEETDWFGGRPVALLKVDTEGHDERVLSGAAELIGRDRPVLLVETTWGGTALRAKLAALGYRVYWYDVATRSLCEIPTGWRGAGELHRNVIAVHDDVTTLVADRLAHARYPSRVPRVRVSSRTRHA